jgi:hypothetical protein
MWSLRFACLCGVFISTMLLAQSNPPIDQSVRIVSPSATSTPNPKVQARILDSYGKLPLSFEANTGQTDGRVKFVSRTGGYTLFLTRDEAVVALRGKNADIQTKLAAAAHSPHSSIAKPKAGGVLRMKLHNANPAARVTGVDELAGTSNYFIGNDPAKWRASVPTYAKVKYEGIYSGIDLIYYGNQRQLEYDFIVAPGADPHRIALDVRGAKRIRRDGNGELVFKVGEDEIRWHKPVVYQEKDGTRQEIAAHYAVTGTNRVKFEVAGYDTSRSLFIDPLVYSTYLGGSGYDMGFGIAVDGSGNAYVVGNKIAFIGVYNADTRDPPENGNGTIYGFDYTESTQPRLVYLGANGIVADGVLTIRSVGNTLFAGVTSALTEFDAAQPRNVINLLSSYRRR